MQNDMPRMKRARGLHGETPSGSARADRMTIPGTSTVDDIARMANVSTKTVSRVINKSPLVNTDTRDRILALMAALRDPRGSRAPAAAASRRKLIGLVYDNPTAHYVIEIQRSVLDALKGSGFELVVHPCDSNRSDYVDGVRRFTLQHKLHGLVLIPRVSEDELLATALRETGCRYVRVASIPLDDPMRTVLTRDRQAGMEAAHHLMSLGHRRLGVITGPRRYRSSIERAEGFAQHLAVNDVGLSSKCVYLGGYTFESGVAGAEYLLAQTPRPTAIFACNDEMAAGIYKVAMRLGLSIPEDLSVVGYDDSPLACQLSPGLTTIHLPVSDVGRLAVQSLLGRPTAERAASAMPGLQAAVTPRLTIRDSTGVPAGGASEVY
ncbi:periplasmic binding and sugar binding domain of LacI family protein [Lysobacter gummosus]|nr:periplasmic binding and sugar binding domain of LacI family protein [Lysobacter gummosus]